ncbi:MAG: cardiolipin synthase [Clostridia bacterium]|nr:cardiolipin synthase [Clostridia bacterium]MBQ8290423.1 cardiolipin synthase [Clostridia bacterium]
MKKTIKYKVNKNVHTREINYIPVRYIIAGFITLFEVLAIIAITTAMCYFVPYFYLAAFATEIFCVIKIIASDDNPDYKVPWLLFVLIIPIGGFMLYFLFYSRTLEKKFRKRLRDLKDNAYSYNSEENLEALEAEDAAAASQARMLMNIAETGVFSNTKTKFFPLGEDMHKALLEDLNGAEKFIYMEYFIIEDGKFWGSILDILKKKAKDGVDVKLLYDDIGCMSTLPGDYCKTLKSYGIEATPFSRLKGNADSEFNNRSHRKITVIDGHIGYTGGVNIADEYINEVVRFGHWKDTAIRLEGDAVYELTHLFLIDYGINVKKMPTYIEGLYPKNPKHGVTGYVIPFGDGPRPIYERQVGKCVIQNMLAYATRYMWMTSPYLIIDNELCSAIENAALRGVDVRIVLPHIPDKRLVFSMTRSFYQRLISAGVKIYEYTPGFIHSKCYVADGRMAMIGTINLDYRSLVHHFENGVLLYGTETVGAIDEDIRDIFERSMPVTRDMLRTNLPTRFLRAVVRIFAPML